MEEVKRIYFLCPAAGATGGTELAHQAAAELRAMGVAAEMLYFPACAEPVASRFQRYNVPYVFAVEDDASNRIVFPESMLRFCEAYRHVKKTAWWMSVDNALTNGTILEALVNHRLVPLAMTLKIALGRCRKGDFAGRPRQAELLPQFDLHLYQSEYARRFLRTCGVENSVRLSDFINPELMPAADEPMQERVRQILYNPFKGICVTKRLKKKLSRERWIALSGYSPGELKKLFQQSMLYVDFGHHPGKDRLLREAAVNGCVVITSKRGAAGIFEDVPIADEFKFEVSPRGLNAAAVKIRGVLEEYEKKVCNQEAYRQSIMGEREVFLADLRRIFRRDYRTDRISSGA